MPAPAFYIAVVPDMVGGRLSSHDRDLLGLAHSLAGSDGAVLAVVFGEHKESNFFHSRGRPPAGHRRRGFRRLCTGATGTRLAGCG
ncbi:electron transfer flavoprotein subunit alpha [Pseudomonas putida S11]|nr:electron transfer flavoprotein subunit alpha [Pseudomonas putida S11]